MHGIEGRERGGDAERERCQEMDSQIVGRSTHKHEKRESIISQIEKYWCLLHPQIQIDAVEIFRAGPRTIAKFVFCFQRLFREKVEEEEEEAGLQEGFKIFVAFNKNGWIYMRQCQKGIRQEEPHERLSWWFPTTTQKQCK